mmetsp:Transcript_17819/g.35741  ORF Transcript_17819/g.35741 Transcript_17819/m.35741 type:complete len:1241 (+) Transcript_17819:179-3901(+)
MQTPPPEENDGVEESNSISMEPLSDNNNGIPPLSDDNDGTSYPSAFISAPSSLSVESSEEVGSSVDDAQKKFMYRQQLRNAAAANARFQQRLSSNTNNNHNGGDDDTSLSSSNLSPMPSQRVQLTSSNSDIKFTERRNKIKAAARSPLMRLQSETSSGGVSGNESTEAMMLEAAALLPPSASNHEITSTAVGRKSETTNNKSEENNGHQQQPSRIFPTMPKLDSTDSLRGMELTSSGGEESSLSTSNKQLHSSPQRLMENTKKSSPLPSTTTLPETDIAKRSRRKMAHKRQRSGDLVAATIMNRGKDWIGMNRDNLPLPETPNYDNDDGSSSLLPLPTPEEERSNGGGASPLYPYPSPLSSRNNTSGETHRIFSPDSSELYDFSDSTVDNTNARLHHHQQQQQYLHQQQQQQQIGGYGVDPRQQQQYHHRRHPSGHSHHSGYSGQYNAVPMYDTYGYSPMQWYQPNYQEVYNNGNMPEVYNNGNMPEVYRHRNESEEEDDTESYYTGSGEGEEGSSTTSSSYVTDEDEDASKSTQSSPRSNGEIPQHPFSISGHNSNKPSSSSFDMDPPEIFIDESDSKIDRIIQKVTSVLDVPLYRTKEQTEIPSDTKYPTFFCPNCKTKQRAFLSVATASEQQSSPLGYLALYFAVYMVASLFIFGLEEGWQPLDCVYFSVITLTTAGLGDFVPTTDIAKIICACFIYVGVATIGLLLGSLLAGSLDDATKKDAYNAQVKDCPNCQRLERLKAREMSNGASPMGFPTYYNNTANNGYEEVGETAEQSSATSGSDASFPDVGFDLPKPETTQTPAPRKRASHTRHMSLLVSSSPKSQQKKQMLNTVLPLNSALKRNSHTRHMSLGGSLTSPNAISAPDGLDKIDESTPLIDLKRSEHSRLSNNDKTTRSNEVKFCEESSYSTSTTDSSVLHHHPSKPLTRLKAAKYIFLTLNQALANSVFVIAAGSIGFYYIEDMTVVDSFYFTTVLLTSVGYGDIVPVTAAGKMFTTVFIIVAGTILLHNMTLISMIPLELRKRRIEHAVLGQFGDQLTDDELRELSTGTLVNRLKLATNRPDGLDECTREMFSLAMLVRLGRVTEEDVKATFAAFRRLDVGNYGRLNSRTIIEGELMRRRALSSKNLMAMSKESEWDDGSPSNYSQGSYAQGGPTYAPQIPSPHFQFMDYSQQGQMPMYPPPNYAPGPGMYGATPRKRFPTGSPQTQYSEASRFDFDEYEQWASNWDHYDTFQTRSH